MSSSYPLSTLLALSISLGSACLLLLALALFLWIRLSCGDHGNRGKRGSKKNRKSYCSEPLDSAKTQQDATNNPNVEDVDVALDPRERALYMRATHSRNSVNHSEKKVQEYREGTHDFETTANSGQETNYIEENRLPMTKKLVLPRKVSRHSKFEQINGNDAHEDKIQNHDAHLNAKLSSRLHIPKLPKSNTHERNSKMASTSSGNKNEDLSLRKNRAMSGLSPKNHKIESTGDLSTRAYRHNKLIDNLQSSALGSFRIHPEKRLSLQPPPKSSKRQRGSLASNRTTNISPRKISPLRIQLGPIFTENNMPLSVAGSPISKATLQSPHQTHSLDTPPAIGEKTPGSIGSSQSTPMYTANESPTMSSYSNASVMSRRIERERLNNKASSYSLQGQYYQKLARATASTSPERVMQSHQEQVRRMHPTTSIRSMNSFQSSPAPSNFYACQQLGGIHAPTISSGDRNFKRRPSNGSIYLATQMLPSDNKVMLAQEMLGEILSQDVDVHESSEHVGRVHVEGGHSIVPSISGSLVDPHLIDHSSFVRQVPEAPENSSDAISRDAPSQISNCPTPPDKILSSTRDSLEIHAPSSFNLENRQDSPTNSTPIEREENFVVRLKSPLSFVDLSDPTRLSRTSSLAVSHQTLSSSSKDGSWGKLPSSPTKAWTNLHDIGLANGIRSEVSIQHNSKLRSIRNIAALEPPKTPRSPGYEPHQDAKINGNTTRIAGSQNASLTTHALSSAPVPVSRLKHKPVLKASLINKPLPSTPKVDNGVVKQLGGATFVVAMRNVPRLSDELDLEPGDVVKVYEMFDDGWCVARVVDGKATKQDTRGVYPILCLTRIVNPDQRVGAAACGPR